MEQLILQEAIQNVHLLPKPVSLYKSLISLIISQQISFKASRKLRGNLYQYLGSNEFTPENILKITSVQWEGWGLNPHRRELIHRVTDMALKSELRVADLSKIEGIGPWTLKGLQIMTYIEPDVFLYEDAFIRKHIRKLFGNLTLRQIQKLSQTPVWAGQRSLVSRFLWRLRDSGALKLIQGENITPEDLYL